MAILDHEVRLASQAGGGVTGHSRHLFTRETYRQLRDAGAFGDSRIEMIEGEIIDMAPIGPFHAAVTHPLAVLLETAFGKGFCARNQTPISLGDDAVPSEPQPDVTIAAGEWRDYRARKPSPADIQLVVEIAESSLAYDRTVKAALYASAGIPEYWIVNLQARQLEIYREPSPTGYRTTTIRQAGDIVEPLRAPGSPIAIADFLA